MKKIWSKKWIRVTVYIFLGIIVVSLIWAQTPSGKKAIKQQEQRDLKAKHLIETKQKKEKQNQEQLEMISGFEKKAYKILKNNKILNKTSKNNIRKLFLFQSKKFSYRSDFERYFDLLFNQKVTKKEFLKWVKNSKANIKDYSWDAKKIDQVEYNLNKAKILRIDKANKIAAKKYQQREKHRIEVNNQIEKLRKKQKKLEKQIERLTNEQKNALMQGQNYVDTMFMSKMGVYDQLTSPYGGKFEPKDVDAIIDLIQCNWDSNATHQAINYSKTMSMSKQAVYDQLVSPYGGKFNSSQATHAIKNLK